MEGFAHGRCGCHEFTRQMQLDFPDRFIYLSRARRPLCNELQYVFAPFLGYACLDTCGEDSVRFEKQTIDEKSKTSCPKERRIASGCIQPNVISRGMYLLVAWATVPSFPHVFISFDCEIGIGTLGGCNPFLGAYEHGSIICTNPFLNLDAARTRSPTMRIAMDPPRARVHPPKRAFSAGHAALPRLSFAWDDHSGLQCRLVDASSMRFSHTWWWSDA